MYIYIHVCVRVCEFILAILFLDIDEIGDEVAFIAICAKVGSCYTSIITHNVLMYMGIYIYIYI